MHFASFVFSICHSLTPSRTQGRDRWLLWKDLCGPCTTPQHPEESMRTPDILALLRLPVSPASLLLSMTLHCLERGMAESSWGQGWNTQQAPHPLPHVAVEHTEQMWLCSWNHPAPRASSSQPPRAPESQDFSDRLCSFTCAQFLPS